MISYYLLYFFLAFKSLEETQAFNTFKKETQNLLIIFLSLLIGLRYEVGGDWDQYIIVFNKFRDGLPESWIGNWSKLVRLRSSRLSPSAPDLKNTILK